ncbi:MAG: hypothetical protein HFJ42_01790 [Clostridia bacterium]|nr:hypothetical protein [Clostridia bacterium]
MKFLNILLDKIKNLDAKVVKVMKAGFIFSFIVCILSSMILLTYEAFYSLPTLFYIGISLFRTSLSFAVAFFICGIGFDTVQKEIG